MPLTLHPAGWYLGAMLLALAFIAAPALWGFSAAVATLALGIGSSVALFSLVDAVLLRPLPYPAAEELVLLWDSQPEEGRPRSRVSGFNYLRWREEARSFEGLALLGFTSGALTGLAEPIEVEGFRVTCNTFAVLGVKAEKGRALTADDCGPAAPRVMVVSNALWRRRFGADPLIVRKALTFAGQPITLVGVMPPVLLPATLMGEGRFRFGDGEERIFMPLGEAPTHHGHVFGVLGRLRGGVRLDAARLRAACHLGAAAARVSGHPCGLRGPCRTAGGRDSRGRLVRPWAPSWGARCCCSSWPARTWRTSSSGACSSGRNRAQSGTRWERAARRSRVRSSSRVCCS